MLTQKKNITKRKHFGVYKLPIHKTTAKMTINRMFFSAAMENWTYCRRGAMRCFANTAFLCIDCNCFSRFLSCLIKP